MALKIMPHGRLQEWVAEEKGYFAAEGLEYSFVHDGDYGIAPYSGTAPGRSGPVPSRPSRRAAAART